MLKDYEFHYTICNQFDGEIFDKQCTAMEKRFPNLKKEKLLEDVDGTALQLYHHENGDIHIVNDYVVGCVYVDSDFDLLPYFKKSA